DGVERTAHAAPARGVEEDAGDVVAVDPRHPLLAAAEAAAHAHAERLLHAGERAAGLAEHHPDAHDHHAHPERLGAHRLPLPVAAHACEEIGAGCRALVEDLVAAVAVETHGGGRDQHRGARRE